MTYIHKQLAAGPWYESTFMEQMAAIGADIVRTPQLINYKIIVDKDH